MLAALHLTKQTQALGLQGLLVGTVPAVWEFMITWRNGTRVLPPQGMKALSVRGRELCLLEQQTRAWQEEESGVILLFPLF